MKHLLYRFIGVLLFSVLLFSACKKDSIEPPVDLGYDYYPANIGSWVIYNVDSVFYNDFTATIDSFQYQIKEVVESSFLDNEGRTSYRLERYWRNSDTIAWELRDIWFVTLTASTVEKIEENVRYVKLVFPIQQYKKWDGNAFNIYDPQRYEYETVHAQYSMGSLNFDSTLSVLQEEQFTLISEDFAEEIYGKNVGMIYKKFRSVEKEVTGQIKSGLDLTYTAVDFGMN